MKTNILVDQWNVENQVPVTSSTFSPPPPPTHFAMPHYPPNLVQPPKVTRNALNLPNQKPMTADPQPGQYLLTLLKFCHQIPQHATDAISNFAIKRYQMIWSLSSNSSNKFLISPHFSRVYFHFNENCIRRTNALLIPFSWQKFMNMINLPIKIPPFSML